MTRLVWTVAAVLLAVLGLALYGLEMQARGRLQAELATLRTAYDSLETVKRGRDTLYAGEKEIFAGWRERWDTARVAHLERTLDSLRSLGEPRPETVTVKVPVSVLVTADSTIKACSALVLTCEARVAVRDDQIRNLSRQIKAMPKPRSPFWVWTERGLLFYGGYRFGQATAPAR